MNSVNTRTVYTEERGWPGHFCGAKDCRYKRNTLVRSPSRFADKAIVVSTVGDYRPNEQKGVNTPEMIGLNRYYETMAFMSDMNDPYLDADIRKEISFDSNWCLDSWEDDDIDLQADAMHNAVVKEISEKLERGEL